MSMQPPGSGRMRDLVVRHPALSLAVAAILLRLIVLLGRGDYIAFDEGWYLLLGRNLWSGGGYTLSGLQHLTLSPLFPVLAGALGFVTGSAVWGGRIVAAVAAGLLVVPCWHIFERLADRRVALIGCALIATLPSLAAFAAPYWIGWDLWVGAEPLLHLLLLTGIALLLHARDTRRWQWWALAGVAFGAAYLARPEGILVFGLIGLAAGIEQVARRSALGIRNAVVCALAFALTATPYWLYLRDHLDRWALTGRVVELPAPQRGAGSGGGSGAAVIEGMLWGDDEQRYVNVLYGLNADANALSSTYWGVPADTPPKRDASPPPTPAVIPPPASAPPGVTQSSEVTPSSEAAPSTETRAPATRDRPSRAALYARALGVVVPWLLWPLALVGVIVPRSRRRAELLFALPILIASVAIARIVATDPRTQLFIAPLVLFYAAIGVRRIGALLDSRLVDRVRPGFATAAMVIILLATLLATQARWVVNGLSLGSPHHLVGSANRSMGAALRRIVPPDQSVMSWHPALALYADRDWRVLPQADLPRIVRYANAVGCEYVILSRYYPRPDALQEMPSEHIVLHVPPGTANMDGGWHVVLTVGDGPYMFGRLEPAASAGATLSLVPGS